MPQLAHTDLLSREYNDWPRHMTGVLTFPTARILTGCPFSCCGEKKEKRKYQEQIHNPMEKEVGNKTQFREKTHHVSVQSLLTLNTESS